MSLFWQREELGHTLTETTCSCPVFTPESSVTICAASPSRENWRLRAIVLALKHTQTQHSSNRVETANVEAASFRSVHDWTFSVIEVVSEATTITFTNTWPSLLYFLTDDKQHYVLKAKHRSHNRVFPTVTLSAYFLSKDKCDNLSFRNLQLIYKVNILTNESVTSQWPLRTEQLSAADQPTWRSEGISNNLHLLQSKHYNLICLNSL